ncbi:capsid protein [Staphylococcus aureus]|nr:capsid protein [Staphylococcus aureus]
MKTKEELQSEISDIKRQIDLKVKYATRALNNDELEKAEKLEQEITDLRSQIQEKQEELDKLKEKRWNFRKQSTISGSKRSTYLSKSSKH